MLDSVVNFFTRIFQAIGRGFGMAVAGIMWPFVAFGRWYRARGWLIRGPVGIVLLILAGLYGYFLYHAVVWTNFNTAYPTTYNLTGRNLSAGEPVPGQGDGVTTRTCGRSAIVDVTADLIDYNVNQNPWLSSMILYKLGLFGIDWDHTPFLDNKASFQRGVNQALRRTTVELVDLLGRIRGTSQIDQNLQNARGNMQFDEETWYFGLNPFGFKTPTPAFYRSAMVDLHNFNGRLERCDAVFDARADNLKSFLERIANDIGSTSDILRERSEGYNYGWFDVRADDRFWFAYGQLYGYYGILYAARADFEDVIGQRLLGPLWDRLESQFKAALRIQPLIISNGNEAGWIMPTHLATMGFYVLRVRANLDEIEDVLQR